MGKTIPFQVDQQMFCRENAKLPASLDNTKRKAKPVQWGIQQFTMLARSAPFLFLLHIIVDSSYPVALEKGKKGGTVNHQDIIKTA